MTSPCSNSACQSYPKPLRTSFRKLLAIAELPEISDTNLVTLTLRTSLRRILLPARTGDQAEPLLKRALAVAMLGTRRAAKVITSANPQVAEIETTSQPHIHEGSLQTRAKLFRTKDCYRYSRTRTGSPLHRSDFGWRGRFIHASKPTPERRKHQEESRGNTRKSLARTRRSGSATFIDWR